MKIGLIREGKVPQDSRVALSPVQCKNLMEKYNVEIMVEPSSVRCIPDKAYSNEGIQLTKNVEQCDVLIGIKEVPISQLIPNKTYCFFSHTIKEQPYNRKLLLAILEKNIHLIDYEALTNSSAKRVIAFGRFAGIAGAHNGMMTWGMRTKDFDLPQMKTFDDFNAAIAYYKTLKLPNFKVVVTGTGRVANGAVEVLDAMGLKQLSPEEYLTYNGFQPVYTQLAVKDYVERSSDKGFDKEEFYSSPKSYQSKFAPYTKVSDLFINGIYWDNDAPQFFTAEDMKSPDFNIKVIADVTCDIAPVSSVPSTLFATTIADPVFGYDPLTGKETEPFQQHTVDMMTIDNLPNEMPKDASTSFGTQMTEHVFEELIGLKDTGMIERATVAKGGKLGPHFGYLTDYVAGN